MDERINTASWDADRGYWRIRVQRDGVRREFTCSTPGRTGQRICNARADEWLGGGASDSRGKLRLSDAIEDFALYRAELTAIKRGVPPPKSYPELKMSMLGTYRPEICLLKKWALPRYGMKYLHKFNDADFQMILDAAVAGGLAKKTCKDLRNALTQLLRFFRAKRVISYRPDEIRIPPQARTKGKKVLSVSSLRTLFTSDQTEYRDKQRTDPLIHAYRLAVLCGARPGELVSLEWQNWDKANKLKIRQSLNSDGDLTHGKNDNAVRDISLPDIAVSELRSQYLLQGCPDVGRVFPEIKSQYQFRDSWYRYCDFNGIERITPYELRHTFVSIAQRGLPDYLLKPVVGHSKDMDTHGIYGHEIAGLKDETGEILDGVFNSILTDKPTTDTKVGG